MPEATVKYLMVFSQLTGRKSEKVFFSEGETLGDLIEKLYIKYGRKFRRAVEGAEDRGARGVIFAINGEPKELSTKLHHGDEILISYPVGGGG
jgi:MoaD family protein